MNRHERLNAILTMVLERESVHVEDLIAELGISPATARRDLDELAGQQLITRTRGGATPHPRSSDLPLRYKTSRQASEKSRIARAAAAMVESGQVVGLNGGTTTTEVAREIAVRPDLEGHGQDPGVVVVTNAVNIANELTIRPHLKIVVTGGVARALSYELTGPLAEPILEQISLDILFLGVNALHPAQGAFTMHEGEASTNAILVRRAQRVVVVADGTKLGRTAFARICTPDKIHTVITDDSASRDMIAALKNAGIEVLIV